MMALNIFAEARRNENDEDYPSSDDSHFTQARPLAKGGKHQNQREQGR